MIPGRRMLRLLGSGGVRAVRSPKDHINAVWERQLRVRKYCSSKRAAGSEQKTGKDIAQQVANLEHAKLDAVQVDSASSTFTRLQSEEYQEDTTQPSVQSVAGDAGGDGGARHQRNFLLKVISIIGVGVVGGSIGLYLQKRSLDAQRLAIENPQLKEKEAKELAYKGVIASQWHIESEHVLVERPAISAALSRALTAPEEYVIVAGPRGSGKTTAVARALEGRKGVIHIKLSEDNIGGTWKRELVDEFYEPPAGVTVKVPSLQTFLSEARRRAASVSGEKHPLTLVVEVVSTTSMNDVAPVAKTLKDIGVDDNSARCLLVLSDAKSLFALPGDVDRQRVVWIDGFTEAEAEEYFDKSGVWQGEEHAATRRKVIEQVGLRPLQVVKAVVNADRVDEYIEETRQKSKRCPVACIARRSDFATLFTALLLSQEGRVSFSDLPVPLGEARRVLEEQGSAHVVLYHPLKECYEFHSPASRFAVQQWYEREWIWPIGNKSWL